MKKIEEMTMEERIDELYSLHCKCLSCMMSYGQCQGVDLAPCGECNKNKRIDELANRI